MGVVLEFWQGTKSLFVGMGVTMRHFFRKPVTLQYPRDHDVMSKAQRNAIVLIPKAEAGDVSHNCIACLQCEKICPSYCIKIESERPEGLAFKRPTKFDVNFALCSECGLCLDVCPTETLGWSKTYDDAGYHRDDFIFDLQKPFAEAEEQARQKLREEEARKKAERDAKRKAEAEAKKKAEEEKAQAAAAAPPEKVEAAEG